MEEVEAAVEVEVVAAEAVAAPVGVLVEESAVEVVAAPVEALVGEEVVVVGEVGEVEVIGMRPSSDGSSTIANPIPAVCRHHLGRRTLHRGLPPGQEKERGKVADLVARRR